MKDAEQRCVRIGDQTRNNDSAVSFRVGIQHSGIRERMRAVDEVCHDLIELAVVKDKPHLSPRFFNEAEHGVTVGADRHLVGRCEQVGSALHQREITFDLLFQMSVKIDRAFFRSRSVPFPYPEPIFMLFQHAEGERIADRQFFHAESVRLPVGEPVRIDAFQVSVTLHRMTYHVDNLRFFPALYCRII